MKLEGKRILKLTLKKAPFEVMMSGEKTLEFRKPSDWIKSRLVGRHYDLVEFTNGYGATRPRFYAEFRYFTTVGGHDRFEYSNGLTVDVNPGDFAIALGAVFI